MWLLVSRSPASRAEVGVATNSIGDDDGTLAQLRSEFGTQRAAGATARWPTDQQHGRRCESAGMRLSCRSSPIAARTP
eukprot:2455611-Prymnesium_polylepis.1